MTSVGFIFIRGMVRAWKADKCVCDACTDACPDGRSSLDLLVEWLTTTDKSGVYHIHRDQVNSYLARGICELGRL